METKAKGKITTKIRVNLRTPKPPKIKPLGILNKAINSIIIQNIDLYP
jgi:hypothetical protein